MDDPQYLIRKGGITYELDDITAQGDDVVERISRAVHEFLCRRDIMQYLDNDEDCEGIARAALAAMQQQAPVKLDWRAIAKAAGEHGVRYRTNSALMAFFAQIGLTQPQAVVVSKLPSDCHQPDLPSADDQQADAAVAMERKRRPRLPALSETLYETYPVMSAQTHEAYVKEYAREAVDAAIRAGGQQ